MSATMVQVHDAMFGGLPHPVIVATHPD